jgi:hypothetical protein
MGGQFPGRMFYLWPASVLMLMHPLIEINPVVEVL